LLHYLQSDGMLHFQKLWVVEEDGVGIEWPTLRVGN
jgi:hypothetical protein